MPPNLAGLSPTPRRLLMCAVASAPGGFLEGRCLRMADYVRRPEARLRQALMLTTLSGLAPGFEAHLVAISPKCRRPAGNRNAEIVVHSMIGYQHGMPLMDVKAEGFFLSGYGRPDRLGQPLRIATRHGSEELVYRHCR